MKYAELAAVDSTADQDLALTIAFKTYVASLATGDVASAPATPGAYLALRVLDVLGGYTTQHVGSVKKTRVSDAFDKATDQDKQQVAAILKVSLTVAPVADAAVAEAPAKG